MNNSLYMKDSKYFLITNKGTSYNIALEFLTYNNKIISNDDLNCYYIIIDFNEENLKMIFNNIGIFNSIDFKDFKEYNYILYYDKIYKLNNWLDVFQFMANKF